MGKRSREAEGGDVVVEETKKSKKIKIKNSPNNKTRCKLGAYGCTNNISLIFYVE